VNRGKRSVTADLRTPLGVAIVRRLARTADVVVENFRPGMLERWGLGYDVLSAENPGLVLVRVSGFGQIGPYRERPGFGTLAEAFSGFAFINGTADGPPLLPAFGLAGGLAGLHGAEHGRGGHPVRVVEVEAELEPGPAGAQPPAGRGPRTASPCQCSSRRPARIRSLSSVRTTRPKLWRPSRSATSVMRARSGNAASLSGAPRAPTRATE
jgi:hypothetical protein